MATNLGTAVGYLTLDIEGFTRGIDNATRQMDKMGSGGGSVLESMGTAATKAGTALTAAVTAPIIGFGASVLREGTTFEEAMTKVKNVANLSMSDVGDFREAVKRLGFQMVETGDDAESMYRTMYEYAIRQGSETRYTAEEVASALYYMGLAGWDAAKMMQGLRPMLDLGAATGEDLARVSDIVTDSMNALGIEVTDLSSYTNVLAEMTRSSNTTLDQAGEAFKYAAPLAGSLGYNMQDVAIAIGEFANVGVKGSQAGTGLRQALNSLTNPSERAVEVLDRLGWSMYDVTTGKAKPLMQVMTELRSMFSNMGELDTDMFNSFIESLEAAGQLEDFDALGYTDQFNVFSKWASTIGADGEAVLSQYQKVADIIKIVGVRALPGMLGIIDATDKNFETLTKSVYGADEAYDGLGTAVGMSNELMDTTQGSIYKLTSSISELRIQLFDFLGGPFREVVDKLTGIIKSFNEMDDAQQKNILNIVKVAAVVGPALLVFGKLASVVSNVSNIINGFKMAGFITALTNTDPVDNFGNKVDLLGGLFKETGNKKDDFADNVTDTLIPAVGEGDDAMDAFEETTEKVGGGFSGILQKFLGFGSLLLGGITAVWSFVDAFQNGWDIVHGLLITIGALLAGLGAYLLGVPAAVAAPVAAIIAIVANLVLIIKDHWEEIKAGLKKAGEAIGKFFESIGEFFSNLWEGIVTFFKTLIKGIGEFLGSIGKGIAEFFGGLISSIGSWLGSVGSKLSEFFGGLWNSLTSWFGNILNGIKNLVGDIVGAVVAAGTTIIGGITNLFSMIGSGISGLASAFVGIFTGMISTVMSVLKSIGSAIGGFIGNIVSLVKGTVDSIVDFVSNLASFIGNALAGVFSLLGTLFTNFSSTLGSVLNGIGDWASGVISTLGGFIKSLGEGIASIVAGFGSGIGELLGTIFDGISTTVAKVGSGLAGFLSEIGGTIATGISSVVGKIGSGFAGIWDSVVEIGKNIIEGIFEGIKSGVEWVGEKIGSVCDGIVSGIKKFFKIESPSKVMADEVGRWLPPGIAEGFEDAMPETEDDINDSVDDMIDNINTEDAMINIGTSYDDLQTVMADSYTYFADAVETTEDRLNASLDNMYTKMYDLYMLEQQLNAGVVGSTGYEMTPAITPGSGSTPGGNTTNNAGNTFIFNSPKPIDEIEAARQMEKTQREMEEGFI